jgi:hypothetical protein
MIKVVDGLQPGFVDNFFDEINKTSMKRTDFAAFEKAYQSRDVIISLWKEETLVAFDGSG